MRSEDVWAYDVTVERGSELRIEAELTTRERQELHVKGVAGRFVTDVEVADGARWTTIRSPAICEPPRCRVRYRFSLREAAKGISDPEALAVFGDAYATPPSVWLLHPAHRTPRAYRIHVRGDGHELLPGLPPAADGSASTFEAHGIGLDDAPYFAFGAWRRYLAKVGGAELTIGIASTTTGMRDADLVEWVATSANGIASYLKTWPTARPLVLVAPGEDATIDGRTLGDGGGSILVTVGSAVTPARAREDWVLTHEMIHLSMPSLGAPHTWLEEGMATYLEPIVRVRAGHLPAEQMWGDLLRDAHQGLPQPGDEGLERTHTWERTYWGGALFCLLADVEIRERTQNARSLDDALRAIAGQSGGVAERWTLDRFVDAGDRATGVTVLRELYAKLGRAPGSIDLAALWKRLGVSLRGGRVAFDDSAPSARVRHGINGE
jgi:hypothetical protein